MEFIATVAAQLSCLILKMRNVTSIEELTWYIWMTAAWRYNISYTQKVFLHSSNVPGLLHCWRWTWSWYSALEFQCGQLSSAVLVAGQYCSAVF